MKKILVVSDSHYENDILQRITEKYRDNVDLMIHCGDSSLEIDDPLLKDYIVVKGNHDYADFPLSVIKDNILIVHGQKHHVYESYDYLLELAKQNNCQIVLHGHTHVPTHQIIDNIHFINPGCLMINRGSYGYGTYAIINIDKDIDVHFYHHITDKKCDEILEEGLELLEEFKLLVKEKISK